MKTPTKTSLNFSLLIVTAAVITCGSAIAQEAVDPNCKPKHEFTTVTPGVLTVAVVPVPPTVDLKDGKVIGFEGALLNEFARMECLKVEAQDIAGAGIIPAVQAKRVDVATGGWYRSKRRTEIVGLSYPTMISQMALISMAGFKTYQEAKGHSIGTPQGNLWMEEAQKYYGDDLKIYQSFDQVYADLRAGRIEAGLVTYELAKRVTEENIVPGAKYSVPPGIPEISTTMEPPQVGFPTVLDNAAFLAALDDDLKAMHESGFVAKALEDVGLPGDLAKTGSPYLID